MRPLLHLLSFVLLLPSLVLASGFLVLGHAIAGGTLLELFSRLLQDALWLASGGAIVVAAFLLAILIGGFFSRTRYIAAACVAILAVASAIVLIALASQPFSGGLFLLPGLVSLCASAWLALDEWPSRARIQGPGPDAFGQSGVTRRQGLGGGDPP